MKPPRQAFLQCLLAGFLAISLRSVAGSLLHDSEHIEASSDLLEKTQPEEVTLLQQPRNDALYPSESSSNRENWKKWTPNGGYQEVGPLGHWVSSAVHQKSSGRFNCSHYGNCHDCIRHGCYFMACGHHTLCINGQTYLSWSGTSRCNRIDKCSAHPKRNIQQLTAASSFYQPNGLTNTGPKAISRLRSNPHSRASNRFRNTNPTSSTSSTTPSSRVEGRREYEMNYFSRSNYPNNKFGASHDNRAPRTRYANRRIQQSPSLMSGRNVYPISSPSNSSNTKLLPTIGIGTVIALLVCSCLVVSAVITVAVKKIRKIYNHNKSMAYGTLEEDAQ